MKTGKQETILIVLSGNAERIREQVRRVADNAEVSLVQKDEKAISRFGEMLRLMKAGSGGLCFGCKDLESQRYQFILKSYLLLGTASRKYIIDEEGRVVRFALLSYLAVDVPKFLIELVASAYVVVATTVLLTFLKLKKHT